MIAALLSFAVFIVSGVLILDLVPLQEPMRCKDYDDTKQCPESYYSQDYYTARSKFRSLARLAGADAVTTHLVYAEDFSMDVAVFKGNSEKVLVHASGTHGVEGFVGSAIQARLLSDWNRTNGSSNYPTIVLVHAVNPYGFAKLRRTNEHNVDLNRNCLTPEGWKEALARDPDAAGFESLSSGMVYNRPPNLLDRYLYLFKVLFLLTHNSIASFKKALVTGQYHDANAPYYGGKEPQRSLEVLREILTPILRPAKKVVFIDVHSGLGKRGVDTFMMDTAENESVAKSIWPAERVESPSSTKGGVSQGYDMMTGGLSLKRIFPHIDAIEVVEEFGTISPLFVARAIVLENAAYVHARDSHLHEITQRWSRDAFYPQDIAFKSSVLRYGVDAFVRAVQYLQTW